MCVCVCLFGRACMLAAWASANFCTNIFARVTHHGCEKTA